MAHYQKLMGHCEKLNIMGLLSQPKRDIWPPYMVVTKTMLVEMELR